MKVSLLAAALIGLFGLTACTAPSGSTSPAPASLAPATATTASVPPSGTTEAPATDLATDPSAAQPDDPAQAKAPAAGPAPAAGDKAHFSGDHATTDAAESAKIIELAKQWHSAEKEALFHEKMDASGLSSHIPAEQAEAWYGQAAAACQRRFDGHMPPLEGPWAEIEKLAVSIYCPELG